MMKCFYCFKHKSRKSRKSQTNATPSSAPASIFSSNRAGTERSSGSVSAEQNSKSSGSAISKRSISDIYEGKAGNLRVFEFGELRSATNDFSKLLKIGEGGFGSVYKGLLRSANGQRTVVAIKKLNQNSLQGHKQWLTEVQFLGVLDHPNLVKLIGYCAVDGERGMQRLLVYEYMPNKSLEDHLFNKAYVTLPWITRLKIALGAAQGLAYLHEGMETQVIFRDFKASNILLDKELKPKLSDFGLAREGPSADHSHVTTAIVGTHGYAAPDYVETGHLTIKSDVWSFGVVVFEILTGRQSLERNRPRGEQRLLEWIKQFPVQGRKFYMIIDPRLRNEYSLSAARMTAKLANQCLLKNPKERPTMDEVVEGLKNAIQVSEVGDEANGCEHSSSDSDGGKMPENAHVGMTESLKRRKSHLAKMGDSSMRRFMTLQRLSRTQHT